MTHRIFPPDSDHATVALWLRNQARGGMVRDFDPVSIAYRHSCTCGVNLPEPPKSVSLIFTRDAMSGEPVGWHLSICCVSNRGYRGYQKREGEEWIELLFGTYRHDVDRQILQAGRGALGIEKDVHHFLLPCDWADIGSDPRATLEGLP